MRSKDPRVIVDTDGGVDDVLALRVARTLTKDDVTVTTVGGNVSAPQAAQTVAFMTGHSAHVGDNPFRWEPEQRHGLDGVHGAWDGMSRPTKSPDASCVIADALVTAGSVILCLGPLTNLADALQRIGGRDELAGVNIFALGGTDGAPEGMRDTNVMADKDASRICKDLVSWVPMKKAAEMSAVGIEQASRSSDWSWIEPFACRTSMSWGWPSHFPVYDAAVVAMGLDQTADVERLILNELA